MKKLTQKQYLDDLSCCSMFLAASNMDLKDIVDHIDTIPQDELSGFAIYRFKEVRKRSRDFVFTREDNTTCYRNFYGKNQYFTHKQILYHVNTVKGRTLVFINK